MIRCCSAGMPSFSAIFGLDVLDGLALLNLDGNGLAREGFDEELHPSAEAEGGGEPERGADHESVVST